MTNHDDYDDIRQRLGSLRHLDVAPDRAARIRQRAHDALARDVAVSTRAHRHIERWLPLLEPAIVASVSGAFLVDVVRRAAWLWTP